MGHSNNLVMAQNPKSENDVRSLQQWYPKYLEHLFNAISYDPEVHSGTSCLVNYIQYIWQLTRKWVNTQPLRFVSKLNLCTLLNRLITNCDDSVAICDCRNLWRFEIQLFRLMSIVPQGILLSAEKMFTSTSDPIKFPFNIDYGLCN